MPRHGVDHAAHLRDEEDVPDGRRGQLEIDRRSRRDDELVDRGDALLGIDEQPFPIERDDLDVDRLVRRIRAACSDRARGCRSR